MCCNLRDIIAQRLQCNTNLHSSQKCGIFSRSLLLLHLSKGDGAHQETGMAKNLPKYGRKRQNQNETTNKTQLTLILTHSWTEQHLHKTLLQKCMQ